MSLPLPQPPEDADTAIDPHIIVPGSPRRDSADRAHVIGQALITALLSNQIMVTAYAVSIVVLAIGLVVMSIMLVYLCFFYPKEANAFLILLGGPLAGVLIAQSMHIKQIIKEREELHR